MLGLRHGHPDRQHRRRGNLENGIDCLGFGCTLIRLILLYRLKGRTKLTGLRVLRGVRRTT